MNSREIARLAGVSRSTVSRVINDYPNVPPKTKEKVNKVIKQYNYHPHAAARNLIGKRSQTVGIFVYDDTRDQHIGILKDDSYYAPIVNTVIDEAAKRNFYTLAATARNPAECQKFKTIFHEQRVDGAIFVGMNDNAPVLKELANQGYAMGVFEQKAEWCRQPNVCVANLENVYSAYKATNHLLQCGHRNLTFVSGNMNRIAGPDRLKGFKLALAEYDIPFAKDMVYEGTFTEESGYHAAQRMMIREDMPTAVFASNDLMAIGVLQALKESGFDVPDDVSVMGFDDILLTQYTTPRLTTLRVPITRMTESLVQNLIDYITEPKERGERTRQTFMGDVVQRASCKRVT